jgi:hypothetical protein
MDLNQLTIFHSNADCVIGAADGVAVALWVRDTSAEDVAALADAARRALRSHESVKLFQIVSATAAAPDGRARTALARMLRGLQGSASHSAIVHEAEGFRAVMIRSIVTGVASLSNPGFPHRVFAKLPEATAWMCESASPGSRLFEPRQLEAVVQQIRTSGDGMPALARRTKERAISLERR